MVSLQIFIYKRFVQAYVFEFWMVVQHVPTRSETTELGITNLYRRSNGQESLVRINISLLNQTKKTALNCLF